MFLYSIHVQTFWGMATVQSTDPVTLEASAVLSAAAQNGWHGPNNSREASVCLSFCLRSSPSRFPCRSIGMILYGGHFRGGAAVQSTTWPGGISLDLLHISTHERDSTLWNKADIYPPCTASSRWSPWWGFVWISCRRGRRSAARFREAKRRFLLRAPAVNPLMIAGVQVPCSADSPLCWHDRCRRSALQCRRRCSGLQLLQRLQLLQLCRRRRLASGPRSAPLLPRPCRNRCPDPAGSAAVASCTSATGPLRRAWHKQPSVVTKQATLHHYNTSTSCIRLISSCPREHERKPFVLTSHGARKERSNFHSHTRLLHYGVTCGTVRFCVQSRGQSRTAECSKSFIAEVTPLLHKVFIKCINNKCLPTTLTQGVTVFIPKPKKDNLLLDNWRPICILNNNYKILSHLS